MKIQPPHQFLCNIAAKFIVGLFTILIFFAEAEAGTTDAELEAIEQQIEQQEQEAKQKGEAEAKQKSEEEAKKEAIKQQIEQQEAEAKRQTQAEAKRKAEEEQLRAEQEEKQKLEEEIRRKIEEEQRLATEKAKRKEEEAKQLAEEEKAVIAEQQRQHLIEESRLERQKRSAKKTDSFGYIEDPVAQDLLNSDQKHKQINITANIDQWQGSGVLITKGNTYKIIATGQWHLGGFCNSTGPDGEGIYSVACWDLGNQTVTGFSHSALIGKIGKQTPAFFVGNEYRFTSDEEGVLYFMANDAAGFFFDNSGSFAVTVSVE